MYYGGVTCVFLPQGGRIEEEASQLIAEHEELMTTVGDVKERAIAELDTGMVQQQGMDELLADADAAYAVAEAAVQKAEGILKDANDTLKTLKEFDQKVRFFYFSPIISQFLRLTLLMKLSF